MRKLPLPLLTVGTAFVHLYLYNVPSNSPLPLWLLFLGVSLQSLASLILALPLLTRSRQDLNRALFLVFILVLSFSICYMRATRFDFLMGCDILRETKSAKAVWFPKHWDPFLTSPGLVPPVHKYLGALGATIFPSVLADVLGVDIELYYWLFTPAIAALVPLFVFLVTRSFFGNAAVTYLATLLFPQIFFFTTFLDLPRSVLGIILLLLMIHCLLKREHRLLAPIFGLGVVTAHYTCAYFAILILLSFLLISLFAHRFVPCLDKGTGQRLSKLFRDAFLLFAILMLSWSIYVNAPLFFHNIRQGRRLLEGLTSFYLEGRVETSYILSSPRGPLITAWFDLQFLMVGVGALLGLVDCIRGRIKSPVKAIYVLTGCSVVGLILFVDIAPIVSLYMTADRMINNFLFFLTSFMAMVLIKLRKPRFRVVFILFFLLVLPMNMLLPSHQNDLMYHPRNELAPDRLLDYYSAMIPTRAGKATAEWIDAFLQWIDSAPYRHKEFVTVDLRGDAAMLLARASSQTFCKVPYPRFYIAPGMPTHFLLLHDLYIKHGLWSRAIESAVGERTGGYTFTPEENANSEIFFQDHHIDSVYTNGAFTLLFRSELL